MNRSKWCSGPINVLPEEEIPVRSDMPYTIYMSNISRYRRDLPTIDGNELDIPIFPFVYYDVARRESLNNSRNYQTLGVSPAKPEVYTELINRLLCTGYVISRHHLTRVVPAQVWPTRLPRIRSVLQRASVCLVG